MPKSADYDLYTQIQIETDYVLPERRIQEAVEWLLLYGPPEIVSVLLQASGYATDQCFPELQPSYTHDGSPVYDTADLAESLGMDEQEVVRILKNKEQSHKLFRMYHKDDSETVH